jgi:hypothetical protein
MNSYTQAQLQQSIEKMKAEHNLTDKGCNNLITAYRSSWNFCFEEGVIHPLAVSSLVNRGFVRKRPMRNRNRSYQLTLKGVDIADKLIDKLIKLNK